MCIEFFIKDVGIFVLDINYINVYVILIFVGDVVEVNVVCKVFKDV